MPVASDRGDFARGIELFNAGRYFESHEILEQVWLRAAGASKQVVQGLIQAAAALLHLQRSNWNGARSLVHKAQFNLANAPDHFMGIALAEFSSALEAFVSAAETGDTSLSRPILRWVGSD